MDIDQFRNYCLSLPGVTEDLKWEINLCFSVGGKMFFIWGLGEGYRVGFKVSEEEFEELTDSPGIIPAPYLARAKWVNVVQAHRFSKSEWENHIQQSYNLVRSKLSRKAQNQLEIK